MKILFFKSRFTHHVLIVGVFVTIVLTVLFRFALGVWPWIPAIDFLQNYHPLEKRACVNNGGRWVERGFHGMIIVDKAYCYYPPRDLGKHCYQNSECEKLCRPTDEKDEEGFNIGRCGDKDPFYCGYNLPNKSKGAYMNGPGALDGCHLF